MTASGEGRRPDTGWRTVFMEMLTGAREAAQRLPVTTLFLLAAALQANLVAADIHLFGEDSQGLPSDRNFEVGLGLVAGATASLAVTLRGEARKVSSAKTLPLALLAGIVACLVLALPDHFLTLEWAVMLGLVALVPIAPFIGRGDSSAFWIFAARSAFAVLLGVLALLLFAGGISAILASLTYLFGIPVPDDLYGHVWLSTGLFAAPLFGLGQLPDRFDETPGEALQGFMDRGMRALGDFVAAPLLILYAIILHLYAMKIAVTGEVPQGQIGWLVLTYGFCIFAALIIINPFFDRARAPTRAFLRLWPFFLPIPLVLLAYALMLRVGEFGITPERYLLGLFGLVTALLLALQLLARVRGDIRAIAALPAAALILGGFGPQGALGVSIASQASRFLEIVNNSPVEGERHKEALGALSFLAARDALARVLPEGLPASALESDSHPYRTVAKAWGLDPDRLGPNRRALPLNDRSRPTAFTAAGFDTVIQPVRLAVDMKEPVTVRLPEGKEIVFALEADALVVIADGQSTLFPVAASRIEALAQLDVDAPAQLRLEADGRALQLIPTYLYIDPGPPLRLENLEATVLLRTEDWR
jgi:hypothetical protein